MAKATNIVFQKGFGWLDIVAEHIHGFDNDYIEAVGMLDAIAEQSELHDVASVKKIEKILSEFREFATGADEGPISSRDMIESAQWLISLNERLRAVLQARSSKLKQK